MHCFVKDSVLSHFSWGSVPGAGIFPWGTFPFPPEIPGCLGVPPSRHPSALVGSRTDGEDISRDSRRLPGPLVSACTQALCPPASVLGGGSALAVMEVMGWPEHSTKCRKATQMNNTLSEPPLQIEHQYECSVGRRGKSFSSRSL